ncbi:tubulin-tyrosine ligase family-domain-containing protein [Chytriomyces sp. MP71]|nr:tubulin-tyrosine ligase family-domain-containing protein [Chytriomyces sp. MP71]
MSTESMDASSSESSADDSSVPLKPKRPSSARVRWKDQEDAQSTSTFQHHDGEVGRCEAELTKAKLGSVDGDQIDALGVPLISWTAGPTGFGRLRFEPVAYCLTQKHAARLKASPTSTASSPGASNTLTEASTTMRLSFKLSPGMEAGILRATLCNGGFREAGPTQTDWNLFWSNGKIEAHEFRNFNKYQKINRFPRMHEMCRKDKMYLNFSRLKQVHGDRHFDFLPITFLLPQEYDTFYSQYLRTGGRWIVKPVSSILMKNSEIIDSLAELPTRMKADDKFLVQKYVDNPLKIHGCRFDLRIYVVVTSFSPLRIYMFKEGVLKFVKERSSNYDAIGIKTTLSALMRHVSNQHGSGSSSLLLSKIKDILIKTFLTGESIISTAVNMFVPHANCFELIAFDILVDSDLNPWLLDVTTSPSLACNTAVDLEVKYGFSLPVQAPLIADLLTLIGVIPFQKHLKKALPQQVKPCRPPRSETTPVAAKAEWSSSAFWENDKLTPEQLKLARIAREECGRMGNFERIFPAESTAYIYAAFIPKSSTNWDLHVALFGKINVVAKPRLHHLGSTLTGDEVDVGLGRNEDFDTRSISRSDYKLIQAKQTTKNTLDLSQKKGTITKGPISNAPWAVTVVDAFNRKQEQEDEMAVAAEPTEKALKQGTVQYDSQESKEFTESISAKLQAREAFQVFLENIMLRLKTYCRQGPSCVDLDYIQQQIQILDQFLRQANELHVGDDE